MEQITDMLQRTTDGAMLVNEDGNVILWNKVAERLLGFHAQDVIRYPCRDVLGRERCFQDREPSAELSVWGGCRGSLPGRTQHILGVDPGVLRVWGSILRGRGAQKVQVLDDPVCRENVKVHSTTIPSYMAHYAGCS